MQITRRARKAIKNDWLINKESRKYHPADYAPGEPISKVEGLPILGADNTNDAVENEGGNEFSLNPTEVNNLTPLTAGNTPQPPFSIEGVLGMPVQQAIDIWHSRGAPPITLGPGSTCTDLEKWLNTLDLNPKHLESLSIWLDKKGGQNG